MDNKEDKQEATLEIGLFGSKCSACGKAADAREKSHLNLVLAGQGCGATFTKVTTRGSFYNEEKTVMINTIHDLRPDLPYVEKY